MQIFDEKYIERDWAWLTARFGRLEILKPESTGPRFVLKTIRVTTGNAVLKIGVLDENSQPIGGIMAVNTYPTLQSPSVNTPDLTTADAAAQQWSKRGDANFTQPVTGVVGFGLGENSWIQNFAVGGPYHAWLFHTKYPSECLSWIGWIGGTDHIGPCDLTFQLELGEEELPIEQPDKLFDVLTRIAETQDAILARLNKRLKVGL
jgi:hypothetical protein